MSTLVIRPDLQDAITATLNTIADCGTWWTGPERLTIARATLNALRAMRSGDVADSSFGDEQFSLDLPNAALEAINLIVMASSSLDEQWYRSLLGHLEDRAFVEMLAVVSVTATIDTIYLVTGLPLPPFPASRHGEPSRYLPEGLHRDVCWVPTIDPNRVGASEMDLYPGRTRPNVGRPLTSVPDAWRMFDRLLRPSYLPFHVVPNLNFDPRRAISRHQMEMIATHVSAHNKCFY